MKNTFSLICIALFLASAMIGFAQSRDSIYHDIRAKYIDEKRSEVALSVFFRTPDNSISLQSRYNLLYKPNDPSAIGIRFQHKWLGLSIAYSPKRLQNKNKGNTSELDLHCFAYG